MKKGEVKLYGLQVVSLDPIINYSLSHTIQNYKGFKGIHILQDQNEMNPVILLFDSIENRNNAYKEINGIKDGDKKEPSNIIVAIVMQALYANEKDVG